MFGRKRRRDQMELRSFYVASGLMTMAQAVVALEQGWQSNGLVTDHLGKLVLAVAANVEEELGGAGYTEYTLDLLASNMGFDKSNNSWTTLTMLPSPEDLQSSMIADLLMHESTSREQSLQAFESTLAPTFGFDPDIEELPKLIALNCHHAALTIVTANEDIRFEPPQVQFERKLITAGLEARLLVIWRMLEEVSMRSGRSMGYEPRPT